MLEFKTVNFNYFILFYFNFWKLKVRVKVISWIYCHIIRLGVIHQSHDNVTVIRSHVT